MLQLTIKPSINISRSRPQRLSDIYGMVVGSVDVERIAAECDCWIEYNNSSARLTLGDTWTDAEKLELRDLLNQANAMRPPHEEWILACRK